MKNTVKYTLVISLIAFSIISLANINDDEEVIIPESKNIDDFSYTIEGFFEGKNTEQITISYTDKNLNKILDTLTIDENGKFKISGQIQGATSAVIRGNIESHSVEDPNYVLMFLETGINKIYLEENNFKNIRFKDNESYTIYRKLENKISEIYKTNNWAELIKMRNSYYGDHLVFPKNNVIKDSLDLLQSKIDEVVSHIHEVKRQFINKNTDEYVSAFVLQMEFRSNRISPVEVKHMYNSFTKKVQLSSHGLQIKEMFDQIQSSAIGNEARDFQATDHLGKTLQLSNFKGKYVLLDFWAGWCKPCKKNHPEMKAIYKQYHDKGLEIIGVSFDRDEEEWQQSILAEDLDLWHQVLGNYRDSNKNAIHNKFNVTPIPAYILIDDKGVIVGRYLGADRYKPKGQKRNGIPELKQKLEQMLPTS